MSAILLDSGIVHYEVIGRGRPIIFLHGWVGSWRYWIPALQAASTSYRAYALDFWGFGESAHEVTRYAIQQQVSLLERFLAEMGIGKVALVGHGYGGLIAMLYALRAPQTVDRLMAIDSPLDIASINARLRTAPLAELAEWLLVKTPVADPARVDAIKADQQALTTCFTELTTYNVLIKMDKILTPTLFVHGQTDPAVANTIDLTNTPDTIHQIILEESGHFPMIDEAARFNKLLIDWLALESGESPRNLQLKEEWRRRVR